MMPCSDSMDGALSIGGGMDTPMGHSTNVLAISTGTKESYLAQSSHQVSPHPVPPECFSTNEVQPQTLQLTGNDY